MVQITTAVSLLLATAAIAPVLALPVHIEQGLEQCVIRPYFSAKPHIRFSSSV